MISEKELIDEGRRVFREGDLILINSWKIKVIEYIIQQLIANVDEKELRNFYLYFENQKDSVKSAEYSGLGFEIKNLFLLIGTKSNDAIISEAKDLKKSFEIKMNN